MRPHIRIKRSSAEKGITVIAFAALLGIFLYIGWEWHSLPKEIPVHFGISGKPDSWGSPEMIWVLPMIGLILCMILTILEAFPSSYNFPVAITEKNAEKQYRNARMLLCLLKTEISCFFVYETWQTVRIATNAEQSLELWSIPVFIIFVFGTIGIFLFQSFKLN